MKRSEPTTREWLECDGCQYVIGLTAQERADGMKVEDHMSVLTVPWDTEPALRADWTILEFHFHAPQRRHDCFRYWATSTQRMRATLEERGLEEEEILEFLRTHLHRDKT